MSIPLLNNMNIAQILNQVAEQFAPGNEEFRLALHAIALAESGGNPYAVGDNGNSIGLFQNNMAGGRGAGHTKQNLLDPVYNATLAAADLINYFNQAKAQGLSGAEVVRFMSRYGQRPAQGLWDIPAKYYGQQVGQGEVTPQAPVATFDSAVRTKGETTPYQNAVNTIVPQAQASEIKPTNPVPPATMTNPYTVKRGDTLWGIAQQQLESGSRWRELQGYTGNPRQMPIGTKISTPPVQRQSFAPGQMMSVPQGLNATKVPTPISPTPAPTPYKAPMSTPAPQPKNNGIFGIGHMEGGIWYPFSKEEKKAQQKAQQQTQKQAQKQSKQSTKTYNIMNDPIGFFKTLPLVKWLNSQSKNKNPYISRA